MRTLNEKEVIQVDGGFLNFIIGSAIGLASYAISKYTHRESLFLGRQQLLALEP